MRHATTRFTTRMMAQGEMQSLFAVPPPPQRITLAGYGHGDKVWLWPSGLVRPREAARVIGVMRKTNTLVLAVPDEATGNRIATLNPILHPHLIKHRSPET